MPKLLNTNDLINTLMNLKQNVFQEWSEKKEIYFGPKQVPHFKVYITNNEEWDIFSIEKSGYIGIDYIFTDEGLDKMESVLKLLIDNFEDDQEISLKEWKIDFNKSKFAEFYPAKVA